MFVNHLKHVFLSAIHKKSSQMLKLIDWFCFCNTDFRTCFKFIASHFKTESCLQLCCITSSFSSNLFNELERQGRPTLVAFIATCLTILPDVRFQLLKNVWSPLLYFLFHNAPIFFSGWQIWTAGLPILILSLVPCGQKLLWILLICFLI